MKKLSLDSNAVKLIAIAAMTVDHLAWAMFPGYPREALPVIMHIIGRLTCPVMCYFVAEGYHYTKNINKYTLRMFLFAVISHFAYIYASNDYVSPLSFIPFYRGVLNQTGVMWSLAIGLVLLRINDSSLSEVKKSLLTILCCIAAFPADWSCIASLWILSFGQNRGKPREQIIWMMIFALPYAIVYFFAIDRLYGIIQLTVIISVPVLRAYNGKRGKSPRLNRFMKWFFYIYYPAHLLVIGLLRTAGVFG